MPRWSVRNNHGRRLLHGCLDNWEGRQTASRNTVNLNNMISKLLHRGIIFTPNHKRYVVSSSLRGAFTKSDQVVVTWSFLFWWIIALYIFILFTLLFLYHFFHSNLEILSRIIKILRRAKDWEAFPTLGFRCVYFPFSRLPPGSKWLRKFQPLESHSKHRMKKDKEGDFTSSFKKKKKKVKNTF